MTENDKKNLFGGKMCITAFFARLNALKRLNNLIEEANKILQTYKEVNFANAYETAVFQTGDLIRKDNFWSGAAEKTLIDIFGGETSEVFWQFRNMEVNNNLHMYAKIRSTLEKKRDVLVEFREELKNL